jgi:hypothetical protein
VVGEHDLRGGDRRATRGAAVGFNSHLWSSRLHPSACLCTRASKYGFGSYVSRTAAQLFRTLDQRKVLIVDVVMRHRVELGSAGGQDLYLVRGEVASESHWPPPRAQFPCAQVLDRLAVVHARTLDLAELGCGQFRHRARARLVPSEA